ncbi:DnaB-like helicase C-terminal domain-containing protein [Candidatus Vidania fulgoroideorum]
MINNFFSEDSEKIVLSSLIIDNKIYKKCYLLKKKFFYFKINFFIYEIIKKFLDKKKKIDIILINNFLSKKYSSYNKNLNYLNSLLFYNIGSFDIKNHINIIIKKYKIRYTYNYFKKKIFYLKNNLNISLNYLIYDIENNLIKSINKKNLNKSFSLKKDLDIFIDKILMGISEKFLKTGFKKLDKLIMGFFPGDLVIVAARPSVGKTSFCLNICEYLSIIKKKAILFCSLEMSKEQIISRMLSSLSLVDSSKIKLNLLNKFDLNKIKKAYKKIKSSFLYINDNSNINIPTVKKIIGRILKKKKIELIVIDYLQLMCVKSNENRNNEISEISRNLKCIAKDLKIPVLALSQLNRSIEQRIDKRPMMSDLRDSGSIEQDADLIIFLHKKSLEEKSEEKIYFSVKKNRNGPTGIIKLKFIKNITKFI